MDRSERSNRVCWVHVSDLHFGRGGFTRTQERSLADALCKDLRVMCKRHSGLRPSMLFMTGDVVYGALKVADPSEATEELNQQWSDAQSWLTKVLGCEDMQDVSPDRVFVVPGNHDVSYAHVDPSLEHVVAAMCGDPASAAPAGTGSPLSPLSAYRTMLDAFSIPNHPSIARYMAHLEAYRNGVSACGLRHCVADPRLIYRSVVPYGEDLVQILGVNTAWASLPALKGRWAQPMLVDHQLNALLSENDEHAPPAALSVVLMHHPASWALPGERPLLYANLMKTGDFVLRGHEHSKWISPWGATSIEISAAAVMHTHPDTKTPGYNIVEVDLDTRIARVFFRQYNVNMQEFETSPMAGLTTSDGAWIVEIGQPPYAPSIESRVALRRMGYLQDDFDRLADMEGVVVTFDVQRFSALEPAHQQEAVGKLWIAVSEATTELGGQITRVVMSPLSDGVQLGIAGKDEMASIAAACEVASRVLGDEGRGRYPGNAVVRAGLDRGQMSVITTRRRSPTILLGSTANRSRKWAYLSDPWSLSCSESMWSRFLRQDPGRFRITESSVFPSRERPPIVLLAPSIRPLPMRSIRFGSAVPGQEVSRVSRAWESIESIAGTLHAALGRAGIAEPSVVLIVPSIEGDRVRWSSLRLDTREPTDVDADTESVCNGLGPREGEPATWTRVRGRLTQQIEPKWSPDRGKETALIPCYVDGPPGGWPICLAVRVVGVTEPERLLTESLSQSDMAELVSALEHLYHVRA